MAGRGFGIEDKDIRSARRTFATHPENLPQGVSAAEAMAGPGAESVKIHLQAAKDARPGRFSRLAVLGRAEGGQVQEAPKIAVVID